MKNNENSNQKYMNENANSSGRGNYTQHQSASKKTTTLMVISIILLLLAGGVFIYSFRARTKQAKLMEDQEQLFAGQLNARDSLINEWILTFNQIEKDLDIIKQKENLITMQSSEAELTVDKKQQILEDFKFINTLLDNNKKKIASLNAQLKKSGGEIKGLQDKIAELETLMKQSDDEISELKMALVDKDFEIGQLNSRMTDLQMVITQKDEKISTQTDEMNKAFLVYGTYKDLEEKGVIVKEGGFLGLGRKESLREDFADSIFSQIDVTETKTIPVNSKDAKLITEHPASSYELIRGDDDKIASIEIKDPDQFWKISKYAVVALKE